MLNVAEALNYTREPLSSNPLVRQQDARRTTQMLATLGLERHAVLSRAASAGAQRDDALLNGEPADITRCDAALSACVIDLERLNLIGQRLRHRLSQLQSLETETADDRR